MLYLHYKLYAMEKLIVKNFGPIKEAEIDLTKYVVFIGDTPTGKSVLAKLIAIFRDNDLVLSSNKSKEFERLLEHYNIDFLYYESNIDYFKENLNISLSDGNIYIYKDGQPLFIEKDDEKKADLKAIIEDVDAISSNIKNYKSRDIVVLKEMIKRLIDNDRQDLYSFPVYIPAERILISIIETSISGLWANNIALPDCLKEFAAKYEMSKKQIKESNYDLLGITYKYDIGLDTIIQNDKQFVLSQTSSGIQSLLPLLLVLDYELNHNPFEFIKNVIIEEPELNLFPSKQKYLIDYIISLFSKDLNSNLVITTHSPYILSVLDTLILAKNTFNEHPDLKEEIAAIVSEDIWIDYNDISVYEVKNDGTIKSIKNEEFKSIDTNAIDGVSDIISEQFDKLTELRYAQ